MVRQKSISARIDEAILERIETHIFGADYPYKRNRNAFLNRAANDVIRIDRTRDWLRFVHSSPVSKEQKARTILESSETPQVLREILSELL